MCRSYSITNPELPTKVPGKRGVVHKSFEDPAAAIGSEKEKLKVSRQVRDGKNWISQTSGR